MVSEVGVESDLLVMVSTSSTMLVLYGWGVSIGYTTPTRIYGVHILRVGVVYLTYTT